MNAHMTSPPLPAPRNRRGGLVQEVVQHLQQLIQSGQIRPGDKLTEAMLAALAQSAPEAKARVRAFLDGTAPKVKAE